MPSLELDPRIVGQRIAEARKSRGKTQEEVAEFLGYSHAPRTLPSKEGAYRQVRRDHQAGVAFFGRKVNETGAGPTRRAGHRPPAATAGRRRQDENR